jgi:hypothetical protein
LKIWLTDLKFIPLILEREYFRAAAGTPVMASCTRVMVAWTQNSAHGGKGDPFSWNLGLEIL